MKRNDLKLGGMKLSPSQIMTIKQATVALAVFTIASTAFGAGGLEAGLSTAEKSLELIKTWLIRLVAVGAVIYLIWKAIEIMRGRGDWGEFTMAVIHVMIVGAAATLASWALGVFA